jgi:hypothetical protein
MLKLEDSRDEGRQQGKLVDWFLVGLKDIRMAVG